MKKVKADNVVYLAIMYGNGTWNLSIEYIRKHESTDVVLEENAKDGMADKSTSSQECLHSKFPIENNHSNRELNFLEHALLSHTTEYLIPIAKTN